MSNRSNLFSRVSVASRPKAAKSNAFALIELLVLITLANSVSGAVSPPYEVGTWRGFRSVAVSYTFDDSCSNQFTVAIPMFNAKGFKLTLFSCTGVMFAGWPQLQSAADQGHEIASHTVLHNDLTSMTAAAQTNEMRNSRDAIDANVTNQKCLTVAYPYCNRGNDLITSTFYIAARTCSGGIVPNSPANFMDISSFVCGAQGSVQTLQDFNSKLVSATLTKGWCVYLIHGIDNDGGYSSLPSTTLQASIDYLGTNRNKFWVETFGHVVRYIRERKAVSVTEISSTNDSITIQVTDNLDDSIYNYPITLRRPLPTNWSAAAVSQNNGLVAAQIINVGSTNYVMFDVVPDGGDVILSKSTLPSILSNPVLTQTNFTFRLDGEAGMSYAIYSSSDLINWSPIATNTLESTSTNLAIAPADTIQFYRAQWVP